MQHLGRSTLTILACLTVSGGAFADTIFSDTTFAPANYSTAYTFSGDATNTVSTTQCAACGNPGQALLITINEPDGGGTNTTTSEQIGLINNTFSYDPATQGAITSIGASVDKDITDNAVGTLGNSFRPLIEQGGLFYAAAISGPTLTSPGTTGYDTIAATGLTAADFLEINPATGTFGTANPDFAGGPLLFGLVQNLGATTVPETIVTFDYDNLTLDLVSASTVPEPGGLPVLLSGMAVLAGLGLIRQKGWYRG